MGGEHSLEQCRAVTAGVLHTVFAQIYTQGVMLEGMILKPNMVLPGLTCPKQDTVDEVAEATVRCLRHVVPAAVPGIAFLSGGQSGELASARLNAMNLAGQISRISPPLGSHVLVCSCDPASGFGYLARTGRQRPGGATSAGTSGELRPGGHSRRIQRRDGIEMSADVRLYLVRHGETEWSLSGQHTGRSDIPLTGHGEDEARALAPCLRDIPFAHVLTSPRQRARRTCELAGLGTAAEIEPDLAEWDYGEYEGRLSADIRELRPGWMVFRDGCPGGEMPGGSPSARIGSSRGSVRCTATSRSSRTDNSAACSPRGGSVCPIIEARHFSLGPASLSVLGFNPDHPGVAVIALWNAVPAALSGGNRNVQRTV